MIRPKTLPRDANQRAQQVAKLLIGEIEAEKEPGQWRCITCITIFAAFTRHCASLPLEAGISDHVWEIEEIADVLETKEVSNVA